MKNILLMASFAPTDGGCIYIDKQARFLFGEYDFLVLCQFSGILRIINNICLSRVFTKIKRLGCFNFIFDFIFYWVVWYNTKYIRKIYAGHQISNLICVSEDILSLHVAVQLKKVIPDAKIHFSMLDLPWSYPASRRFNRCLKRRFCNLFLKNVDSADFTTEDMRSVFVNLGFNGASLITYSAIDVVCGFDEQSQHPCSNTRGRTSIVYAGSIRALAELKEFCDALLTSKLEAGRESMMHMYGPSGFSHPAVLNQGFIVPDSLSEILRQYRFGLVPMSFLASDEELVQTSFPSKAWTYLCCGVVPIVVAPSKAGISRLFNAYNLGVLLSDVEHLAAALDDLHWDMEYERAISNFEHFQGRLKSDFQRFRDEIFQG